jgi:hypothetical protein
MRGNLPDPCHAFNGLLVITDVGGGFLRIHRKLEAEFLRATPFQKAGEVRIGRNSA